MLKGSTGGDVYYTDQNGQRKLAPQSRGTLGKTLIAATLAGLLSKDSYRETPYGPVRDWNGTAANANEAGQAKINEMRSRPQKLSEEAQARAMQTLDNNSKAVALQSAQVRLANEKNDYKIKSDAHVQEMMSPFLDYEKNRTATNDPNQPPAFVEGGRGLTADQAMKMVSQGAAKGLGYTKNLIKQDGWVDQWDASLGRMVPEPTYAILNPALKEITLPKNVTDVLANVNSSYKDIHQFVGGDVKVPVNAYVSAVHDYQAVTQGSVILNNIASDLGLKPVTQAQVEAAARAGRSNRADILPTLYQLNHGVAGNPDPDQRTDNLLDVMLKSPNGQDVLKLLGLTPQEAADKAEEINNKRVSKAALAKEGGVGDKVPADPAKVAQLGELGKALGLTDAQIDINTEKPNPGDLMTQGQYIKTVDKMQAQANNNRDAEIKKLQAGGDPALQAKTAKNVVSGDVNSVEKITSLRGNARENLLDAIHDEAAARGLDTTLFSQAAMDNKVATLNDYNGNKKGSTGSQITSFNAYLRHTAGAVDAEKALEKLPIGPGSIPIFNTAMDKLGKEVLDTPQWKAYETSLLPVQNEISNFLSAGYAVKAEDAELMHQVLDKHETPARITAALRQLALTADDRLASMGETYRNTMGTTFTHLLSTDSINTLKRLGIKSKAIPLATPIPRGWQGDQPSQPSKQVLNTIWQASGGDVDAATQLAKLNGWSVPDVTRK